MGEIMENFNNWLLESVAIEHNNMNKEYFEKGIVGTYPYFYLLKEIFEDILKNEPNKLSCLDFGCGAGWQVKYLELCGLDKQIIYEGLDISTFMCNLAKINYPNGNYYVDDIYNFNPEKKWDIVMACGSIEHIEDWKSVIKRLCDMSNKWVVIHKFFLTIYGEETFKRNMYQNLIEKRTYINENNFKDFLNSINIKIYKRMNWNGNEVSSVILKKD